MTGFPGIYLLIAGCSDRRLVVAVDRLITDLIIGGRDDHVLAVFCRYSGRIQRRPPVKRKKTVLLFLFFKIYGIGVAATIKIAVFIPVVVCKNSFTHITPVVHVFFLDALYFLASCIIQRSGYPTDGSEFVITRDESSDVVGAFIHDGIHMVLFLHRLVRRLNFQHILLLPYHGPRILLQ